jgi:hypothetical protein
MTHSEGDYREGKGRYSVGGAIKIRPDYLPWH